MADRHRPGYWADYNKRRPERLREWREANPELYRAQQSRATKWFRRSIVAWDGEGANMGDRQYYVLLANSRGEKIVNRSGLTTIQCLSFLCEHAHQTDINVIFGGSYDANQWIADLPSVNLRELWSKGSTTFAGYWIRYQWRKCFMVKDAEGRTAVVWDVLGFFQSSFVETVRTWLPEVDVTEMERMKLARPDFDMRDLDAIVEYNADECRLLVRVCETLFRAFDDAGIVLARYDGAGAAAAAVLRANRIADHRGVQPEAVTLAARHAYAGGRIEGPRVGFLDFGYVWRGDINSAYPTHIRRLPCLAHGIWEHRVAPDVRDYQHDIWRYRVTRIAYDFAEGHPFYPYFYREMDGTILYPQRGEGWYWEPEVLSALAHGYDAQLIESWEWRQECDHQPFTFVDEGYAKRAEFRELLRQGDPRGMAHIPMKLWLNSLYGKMAQQTGARDGPPAYHNLCWAGWVTSATRAQMFDVGMQHPEEVIAFATDAVISTTRHDVPLGTSLGQWSEEEFDGICMVQPGVYFLREKGAEWAQAGTREAGKESKYRGFDKGSLVRDGIIQAWRDGCQVGECERRGLSDHYHARVTRFVGAGSALAGGEWFKRWRTWRTDERLLGILPSGKRRGRDDVPPQAYASGLVATDVEINRTPELISKCYPLAWADTAISSPRRDLVDGIDIRIVEAEEADSWE